MSGRLGSDVPVPCGMSWSSSSWDGLGGDMAIGAGSCPAGVVMVTSRSSTGTLS